MRYGYLLLLAIIVSACGNGQTVKSTFPKNDGNTNITSATTIVYSDGSTGLKGFLALPDTNTSKLRPGIIIVPEWWGLNDYAKHRAQQVAGLGYIAFVADMYGDGKQTDKASEAQQWSAPFYTDPAMAQQRFEAALHRLKQTKGVDTNNIAAIGYCFGGTQVLNMARRGVPLKAVVSFHGGLQCAPIRVKSPAVKVLVCNGAADKFVDEKIIQQFKKEMSEAGFQYEFKSYPNAHHAFTNPDADKYKMDNISYNATADTASWNDMKIFLDKLFTK